MFLLMGVHMASDAMDSVSESLPCPLPPPALQQCPGPGCWPRTPSRLITGAPRGAPHLPVPAGPQVCLQEPLDRVLLAGCLLLSLEAPRPRPADSASQCPPGTRAEGSLESLLLAQQADTLLMSVYTCPPTALHPAVHTLIASCPPPVPLRGLRA